MFGIQNPFGPRKFKKTYYSIVSEKANRVLDVAQSGPYTGSLIIWDGYAGDNQIFSILPQQNGASLLKVKKNGGYLTVEHQGDGARVFVSKQPTPQSYFTVEPTHLGSHTYFINTFCGKVLDLYQGNS